MDDVARRKCGDHLQQAVTGADVIRKRGVFDIKGQRLLHAKANDGCGFFRLVRKIFEIEKQVAQTEIKDKSQVWNTARIEALELDNLIEVAKENWSFGNGVAQYA